MSEELGASRSAAPNKWVYRVQHKRDGRGPYRPGVSVQWADKEGRCDLPTWMAEFGTGLLNEVAPNEQMACAFRDLDQMKAWFTATECERLERLGFALVRLQVDRVVAESKFQMVVARRRPFNTDAIIVPWPSLPSGQVPEAPHAAEITKE